MGTSIPPLTFAGASSFSASLQQVLNRSVQIAAMPLTQMQNRVIDLSGEQSALAGLQQAFSGVRSALGSIEAAAGGSVSVSVSSNTIVKASATGAALPGAYSIEVLDIGSSTTMLGKTGVEDPSADGLGASQYTLTVNGEAHTIEPDGDSLSDLAAAINSSGHGVRATIVNVGENDTPDYRLALTSANLGADTIQLSGGADLLDVVSTGTDALYKVNGLATTLHSTSRQVTLAPGLKVTLLDDAVGSPVTVTVNEDYSLLSNTLSGFASAYNNAMDAIERQRGENAGPLSGHSIVTSLQYALRTSAQFEDGGGAIATLAGLGLDVDERGRLRFDATVFDDANKDSVREFLGAAETGGFLKAAVRAIDPLQDPSEGTIQSTIKTVREQITAQNARITREQIRITALQDALQQQLAAADAVIASLEARKNYFTNLFESERQRKGDG